MNFITKEKQHGLGKESYGCQNGKGERGVISRFRSIDALKQVLLFSHSVVSDSL